VGSFKNVLWWLAGLNPVSLLQIASFLLIKKNNKTTRYSEKTKIFYGVFTKTFFNNKVFGGKVKIILLKKQLRNNLHNWNILYLVSSALPSGWVWSILSAKLLGMKIVINQNGVDYPGLHPYTWKISNYPRFLLLKNADFIFYQSSFCEVSVKKYVGNITKRSRILYNPVELQKIKEIASKPKNGDRWHIFLGGNQYQWYRVKSAVNVLASLLRMGFSCDLYISGRLCWNSSEKASQNELQTWVQTQNCNRNIFLTGVYKQSQISKLFSSMHILLHTKNYDPCPTLVIEAMAHGLPIAYVKNGGLPEIVGVKAGIGVIPQKSSMLFENSPEPSQFAQALIKIMRNWGSFSANALKQSKRYELQRWIDIHRRTFNMLLNEDK
jgi:glycosyltransferase involved in cell wall biosynthesis